MDEQFLSYQEYTDLGGTLDESLFTRLEFRAEKIIKSRINCYIEIDKDVKMCVFELINCLQSINGSINESSQISSISNDGYSISYSNNNKSYNDIYGINGILNSYLHKYMKPRGVYYV